MRGGPSSGRVPPKVTGEVPGAVACLDQALSLPARKGTNELIQARPQRPEGLVFEQLEDGAVIYDAQTKQAHSLDPLATRVLNAADGEHTPAEIAAGLGLDEATVHAALDQLTARGLLLPAAGVSRRAILKRAAVVGAVAAAAAPVIETVVIPTAAAHASGFKPPPIQ